MDTQAQTTSEAAATETAGSRPATGFWDGLKAGELNLPRQALSGAMPMLSTFCWFTALLIFAQMSFLIYSSGGDSAEAIRAFSLMAALHAGTLVVFYLSTLAEKDNPERRRDARFPFALSLQASFVESLAIAGVLIYLIGKSFLELKDRIAGEPQPLLSEILRLIGHIKAAPGQEHSLFIVVATGILLLTLIVAHYGFTLLRRRSGFDMDGADTFSGLHARTGSPTVTSDDLRHEIARLVEQRHRLSVQAQKATEAASTRARLNEVILRLSGIDAEIAAKIAAAEILPSHEKRLHGLVDILTAERTAFDEELNRTPAGAIHRHLKRLLSLLIGALALVLQSLSLMEDARRDVKAEIDALKARRDELLRDQERLEGQIAERVAEGAKLQAESDDVFARIERLNLLAGHIDDINADWKKPRRWRFRLTPDRVEIDEAPMEPTQQKRNYLIAYKPGILLLFFLATVLGVLSDFLIELRPLPDTVKTLGGLATRDIALMLATYFALKFIAPIGFVGSWQTIASSSEAPRRSRRSQSSKTRPIEPQPSLDQTLRVIVANLIGLIIFGALFVTLYYSQVDTPGTFWAQLRSVAGTYYLIPFLSGAALFICIIAPLWIYVWESFSRWSTRQTSKVEQPLTWGALVIAFVATLTAGVVLAGMLGAAVQDFMIKRPLPPAADPQSRLECPFVQMDQLKGLNLTGWTYSREDRLEISMASQSCRAHIALDEKANFVVVLGMASEEGDENAELIRAEKRTEAALSLIDAKDARKRDIAVYGWVLGPHQKTGLSDASGELSRQQRPLLILSGHNEDAKNPIAVKKQVTEALARNLGLTETQVKIKHLVYPRAKALPSPADCSGKTCRLPASDLKTP